MSSVTEPSNLSESKLINCRMKFFIQASLLLFQIIYPLAIYAQAEKADSGKVEFLRQTNSENPDYQIAYRILTNQVKADPNNAEYRYFLGYTIDKLNSDDGRRMNASRRDYTIEASKQFEEVNQLQPIYKGEYYILDPYSKISSIWGSLGMAYAYKGQEDSVRWAFMQGKTRGGFIEPILKFNRDILASCKDSALLVSYGDDLTFGMWYLQKIENYRTDIEVLDANLIGAAWYGHYLKSQRKLVSNSNEATDTLEYAEWQARTVTITNPINPDEKFSWEMKPSYLNGYILRGDFVLLSILKENAFKRSIYFTYGSDSTYNLSLDPLLKDEGLVSVLNLNNIKNDKFNQNLRRFNIEKLRKEEIYKSRNAIQNLNKYRDLFISESYKMTELGRYKHALNLIKEMQTKFPKEKLPYQNEQTEEQIVEFERYLKEQITK